MAAGDILPASLWCLTHRPTCNPEGMAYVSELDLWVDIYLQSGTGTFTRSANGATITDTRAWFDHVDDLAAVGKTLLTDTEFQICMEGSNQKTAIQGAADPVTTGGMWIPRGGGWCRSTALKTDAARSGNGWTILPQTVLIPARTIPI